MTPYFRYLSLVAIATLGACGAGQAIIDGLSLASFSRTAGYYYLGESSDMNSLNPNSHAWGRISFTASGATFDYTFSATNLQAANGMPVKLIYYPTPAGRT